MQTTPKIPEIKDIKPPVEIPDSSLYLTIFLGIIALALLILLIWFVIKSIKRKRKENIEKIYLKALHSIDWSNPKKAAYKVTEYGRVLANDDKKKEIFANLLNHLQKYKYRKVVSKRVDSEL